jgi:hypothetical protein
MKNGTFNTSKYMGKLQKMGVLFTHSPKTRGPFSTLPKKKVKKKKIAKNWESRNMSRLAPQPAGNRWSPAGSGPPTTGQRPLVARQQSGVAPFFVHCDLFLKLQPPFWAHVVNPFSLALAHACPTQTSSKTSNIHNF